MHSRPRIVESRRTFLKKVVISACGPLILTPCFSADYYEADPLRRAARDSFPKPNWFQDWDRSFDFHQISVGTKTVRYYRSKPTNVKEPAILLIHGTPGGPEVWWPVLLGDGATYGLAVNYDVIVIELPGHGTSTEMFCDSNLLGIELIGHRSFDYYSQFCTRILDAIVPANKPTIIVGHSYGGEMAWRMVSANPSRYKGLMIIDSSGFKRDKNKELSGADKETIKFWNRVGQDLSDTAFVGPILRVPFMKWIGVSKAIKETEPGIKPYYADTNKVNGALVETHKLFMTHSSRLETAMSLTRRSVYREDRADVRAEIERLRQAIATNRWPSVRVISGDSDHFFTQTNQVANFIQALGFDNDGRIRARVQVDQTRNAAHCPHEEQPEEIAFRISDLAETCFRDNGATWLSEYEFTAYDISVEKWPDVGGVYILSKMDPQNHWVPLYIGQTQSFRLLLSHELCEEARKLGVTHIHVRMIQREATRAETERKFLQAYPPR